ncbi:tRNA (guanosine(46)-N7)-methyltransferase TrmB [Thermostichus vulcanus]|uniref:tRNA (guanine-N(7)-)-methyltransferase n=1 Tax=Thermostichus vulcanus str. 'Rupite' TaxID=2813851 RepID=A0ABT0CC83_THEVL|nr:tRNA (guanosine(46)-N7)-methyltransferase TrmB [Thermostichus vulcanus]MCJ2543356.1 tRNA (guanosine(46)-N7)-methyltransferase TrmB [Thermostichus vulcanus str. 'Rupite']
MEPDVQRIGHSSVAQPADCSSRSAPQPWGIRLQQGLSHRVRQHVNPLQVQYQQPASPPHWERVYRRLAQPFHLDIGTGSGRFLLRIAQEQPEWNFLGVEIRQPLVERANRWRDELGLDNVHFLFGNINVSLRHLFAPGDLSRVTLQFPDPWFKKRHHKRRVVQPQLVADLALLLRPGSPVFLQSDVKEVAEEMVGRFLEHPQFWDPYAGPLDHNPLGIPTQREWHCQQLGLPIYRYWLERR